MRGGEGEAYLEHAGGMIDGSPNPEMSEIQLMRFNTSFPSLSPTSTFPAAPISPLRRLEIGRRGGIFYLWQVIAVAVNVSLCSLDAVPNHPYSCLGATLFSKLYI